MKNPTLSLKILLFLSVFILSCHTPKRQANDDNNLLLGNPSDATADTNNANNYLIDHKYYIESYNRAKGEPNWVCWHLCAADLGTIDRTNNFQPDSTGLPKGWFEADNESYRNSGFDRGHDCPSGDRTGSADANSSTFLMDNIIPQAPNNNRHTWERLETFCRGQVKKGKEAYIIMGSYGEGGDGRLGFKTTVADGHVRVPAHIWKIVLIIPDGDDDEERIDTHAEIIAVNTPNSNAISTDWKNYVCTVRDIEKATGYKFFSALPGDLRSNFEDKRFVYPN